MNVNIWREIACLKEIAGMKVLLMKTEDNMVQINDYNHSLDKEQLKPVRKFNLRSHTETGPMQIEEITNPIPSSRKQRTLKVKYKGTDAVILATHLDDQPLLVDSNGELNGMGNLLEELEFEEEDLQEYEMYYSKG
ncbi:12892_t:CDS:2 [Gigaspora rosea]|nr:12892_t:CDS:2 [Gigaspora rosea]